MTSKEVAEDNYIKASSEQECMRWLVYGSVAVCVIALLGIAGWWFIESPPDSTSLCQELPRMERAGALLRASVQECSYAGKRILLLTGENEFTGWSNYYAPDGSLLGSFGWQPDAWRKQRCSYKAIDCYEFACSGVPICQFVTDVGLTPRVSNASQELRGTLSIANLGRKPLTFKMLIYEQTKRDDGAIMEQLVQPDREFRTGRLQSSYRYSFAWQADEITLAPGERLVSPFTFFAPQPGAYTFVMRVADPQETVLYRTYPFSFRVN